MLKLKQSLAPALLLCATSVQAAVPGGVVFTAERLRDVPGLQARLDAAFGVPATAGGEGASVLMRPDSSVAMVVLSHAEVHDESFTAPDAEIGTLHLRHVSVAGAVVAIAPLSRSIVGVSPVFFEAGSTRPSLTDPTEDLATAAEAFVRRAAGRLESIEEADVVGADLWQVTGVSITSKQGRELLGGEVASFEGVLAMLAGDVLGESGLAVLPASGGDSVLRDAGLKFAAIHGLTDEEIKRFKVSLSPASGLVGVIVDGFSTVVSEGHATRARAYKAWATAEGPGGSAEASAVVVDSQLTRGVQSDGGILVSLVRQAMTEAVRCAVGKLLDREDFESCED